MDQYTNDAIEADHGRLKSRLRPMRGLKRLHCGGRCVAAGDDGLVQVGGLAGARKPVRSAVPRLDRYPGVRNV
jgi:hypothetical protein